jgi:hypothetical protein
MKGGPIIAGDGYAYLAYACRINTPGTDGPGSEANSLMLLRVNSSGASDNINLMSWGSLIFDFIPMSEVNMITNADTGVLLTSPNTGTP